MDTFTFAASLAGRTVGRLGFGAMQLPGPGVWGPPRDRDAALAVLRRAVELGVDHIDTSQYYGPDVANELIHDALHPYPDDLFLVSKVGAVRDDQGGWLPAQTPAELRAGVEDNLRSLDVDRLGAVNLRLTAEGEAPAGTVRVPLEDQLAEMVALRDEGKIAGVGISTASLDQVETAIELADIVCVQNPFSLLDRHDAAVLERCHASGIAYVPYFPLGGFSPIQSDELASVARSLNVTPVSVAVSWLLQRSENILLIPGTSSVEHLRENVAAAELRIPEDELTELNHIAP